MKNKRVLEVVLPIDEAVNNINIKSRIKYRDICKMNILGIVYTLFPNEEGSIQLLNNLIQNYGSLKRASTILETKTIINNKLSNNSISFFSKLGL